MKIRDFVLLGATHRRWLEKAVREVVGAWAEQWLFGEWQNLSVSATVMSTEERLIINRHSPVICGNTDDEWCAIALPRNAESNFLSAMLAESHPEPGLVTLSCESILHGVVVRALDELGRLLSGVTLSTQTAMTNSQGLIPSKEAKNGSGAYAITIGINDIELYMALSAPLVSRLVHGNNEKSVIQQEPVPSVISTFAEALASRQVRAEALMGSVELSIGVLTSLNVGDVIQMDKLVGEPSELHFPGTNMKCKGFLGQSAGSMALCLTEN